MSRRTPKYRQTVFAPQNVDYVPGAGPSPAAASRFAWNRRTTDAVPATGKAHDISLDADKARHIIWPAFGLYHRGDGVTAWSWYNVRFFLQSVEVARLNLTWTYSNGSALNFRPDSDPPLPSTMTGPAGWPSLSIVAYNTAVASGLTLDVPAFDLPIKADRAEMHLEFAQAGGTGWAWLSGMRIISLAH